MTQNPEIERAKARIRALTARTVANGCTDAEAFAAAEMIGRLLDRYMLTMDAVELRASPCIQRAVPMPGRRRGPIDAAAPAIARFCHCLVWIDEAPLSPAAITTAPSPAQPPGRRYVYFGIEADVEMAIYLHAVIAQATISETQAFRAGAFRAGAQGVTGPHLRLAARSFQQGLVSRLAERLDALHAAREAVFQAKTNQSTALVLAKHAMVKEAFAETQIRLSRRAARPVRIEPRAYGAGSRAGDRINLERPIGRTPSPRLR